MPKDLRRIAEKWKERASMATEDYKAGIMNPDVDWAQATAAAKDRWVQGITNAAKEVRFERGVREAGSDKWRQKALTVGADRYAQGVSNAVDEYLKNFGPVYEYELELKRTAPPRYARGDPRNIERVKYFALNLHKKFKGGGA